VKMAEDGEGLIIRLREIAGANSEVLLSSSLFRGLALSAWLTDVVEKNETPVQVSETGIAVPMKAFGIQAVRVVRTR
jgi:hypothetical protein